jgi:hypothetical protein
MTRNTESAGPATSLGQAKRATKRYSFRPHDWCDTSTRPPSVKYGIQAKAVGYPVRWMHCARDNEPLLFSTPKERDAALKELRKTGKVKR